ncbi:MAG TPA: hypothetical protein VFH48_33340 [Chloroflexota bacterium]|nr:hypothetical protein [Chloroflexota bacterium]
MAVVQAADGGVHGLGGDGAAAEGGVGKRVEEAGEEASAVKAGAGDEAAEDFGLDGETDGEGGVGDDLAWSGDAVQHDGVTGVAFEEVVEVGGAAC